MSRIRLRALALVLGIALFALGAISLTAIPAWPVVGVAVACAAVVVNRIAARLDHPICLACGHDIAGQPAGEHGVACSNCGAVNQGPDSPAGGDTGRRA
jgi:hypothetical protein